MDVPVQQDGVTSLAASDYNQTNTELEAMIETSGQTKSAGDLVQVEKAVQQIAVSGQFYIDSGAANTVTLANPNNPILESYRDGATVRFTAANTNTGASTLTIDSLPAANIKKINGADVQANDIIAGIMYEAIYIASVPSFVLSRAIADQNLLVAKEMVSIFHNGPTTGTGIIPTALENQVGISSVISAISGGSLAWQVNFANTYAVRPHVQYSLWDTNNLVRNDNFVLNTTTTETFLACHEDTVNDFVLQGAHVEIKGVLA